MNFADILRKLMLRSNSSSDPSTTSPIVNEFGGKQDAYYASVRDVNTQELENINLQNLESMTISFESSVGIPYLANFYYKRPFPYVSLQIPINYYDKRDFGKVVEIVASVVTSNVFGLDRNIYERSIRLRNPNPQNVLSYIYSFERNFSRVKIRYASFRDVPKEFQEKFPEDKVVLLCKM